MNKLKKFVNFVNKVKGKLKIRKQDITIFIFALIVGGFYQVLKSDPSTRDAILAFATVIMAFAAFWAIQSANSREENRQTSELNKEDRDRKERLLNEIIEWAIDVARCGSTVDFPTILEDIGKLPEEATKIQGKIWRSTFINLLFRYQAIDAKSEYINNAALIFEKEVSDTVAEVIDKLDKVIVFVPELVKNVKDEETKDKLSELERSLQKTATALIRVATKIKTRDIS